MLRKFIYFFFILLFFNAELIAQKWIVKDSILVYPQGFASWLKRNNGGVDLDTPSLGNSRGPNGTIGSNQGVDFYDFNKDGLVDLTFQLFPANDVTRFYLKGIFLQNKAGKFELDTNYVISGKGDMWFGAFGDFNGDGLVDYEYMTHNYHGQDSNRKFSPEMINDNWPERVFINNGRNFDTLSLDLFNINVESTYAADVDKDGSDEIIATGRHPDVMHIYKYNKLTKKFYRSNLDLNTKWNTIFPISKSKYPVFNVGNVNNQNEFVVMFPDNSISLEINEPDWQPYNYKTFSYVKYNFSTDQIQKFDLKRDSVFISAYRSKQDADDYYKFVIHSVPSVYRVDVNNDNVDELVIGGYYMNDYYKKGIVRYAYGWKVFDISGNDLTTQYFKDSGYDKNTELYALALDIDETSKGVELIPGLWGNRSVGELGNYYKIANNKIEKNYVRNVYLESGKKLDSTYFRNMAMISYPNYKNNKGALVMFDMDNLRRAAIIYQTSCVGASKPSFDKSKYSICGTDSTIVKISNSTTTDSLKWYVNNKLVTNNLSQYVFKERDTFYVSKLDSNGCLTISDTVKITKYTIPSAPIIQRDTANYLLSTSNNTTWYKDGTELTDTAQKIKPSTAGSYTAKTTQNGCVSQLSNPYYYLVTDIVNLENGEYIKLSPNPFQDNLSIDFNVKGYQYLNIELFELSTGNKVGQRNNVYPGTSMQFNNLNIGTFIIRVTSFDNKINCHFKMVKI